ncbi:PREDICTED: probable poly(ADP-ribose) glycohydrolase 2 [Brassica oleracea var. oleracea]|uniref:probable poly(ADP-ribose) glycohydrolase 2 n=1 Tax=Brassica oleracea var. oleracea TaxID=109376 RepID=UPI0006A6C384|nr:PREDICTED: probable poly(ADP-ribose) glycohydrolase 2 [Brassica oleracea var. oleracea]
MKEETITSGLRLLGPQEAGIVFLSQELIAALLACSFFCLFPEVGRRLKHLQGINFDELFWKVLPLEYNPTYVSYPEAEYWAKSTTPLCSVQVHSTGVIEDQPGETLEVEFADEYFGGLTLRHGCLQEEIRFMMNPELIAGMLFLPRMDKNEAIEIVGAERFTLYTGFGSSFQFAGDYLNNKELERYMRRRTRVVAIDAIPRPGRRQYKPDGLLREVNKAFTGYLHQCKHQAGTLPSSASGSQVVECSERLCIDHEEKKIGVATGNWGCGVFGGDPEVKIMLQWLTISQSGRPFMSYYTFGLQALQKVNQVVNQVCKK